MRLGFRLAEPLLETPGDGGGGGGTPSGGSPPSGAVDAGGTPSGGDGGQPVQHDPIPWDQHETVRTKAEKLAWAEKFEPERVTQATTILDWLDRDPAGAHAYLTRQLENRGVLARQQQTPQQPQPHTDPQTGEPLADITLDDGRKWYSEQQLRRHAQWQRAEIMREIDPLKKFAQGTQTNLQAQQDAREKIAEAESWEGFNENAKEIYAELQRDKRLSLEGAYIRVVPKALRMNSRREIVGEMRQKVNAGTHNPASGGTRGTEDKSKMKTGDLLRHEMQKRGIGR